MKIVIKKKIGLTGYVTFLSRSTNAMCISKLEKTSSRSIFKFGKDWGE